MLSMPCKALAETCEADNSMFNMPILLAVALIGATVGGKVLLDYDIQLY
jgi:ligand-binding sensor protein